MSSLDKMSVPFSQQADWVFCCPSVGAPPVFQMSGLYTSPPAPGAEVTACLSLFIALRGYSLSLFMASGSHSFECVPEVSRGHGLSLSTASSAVHCFVYCHFICDLCLCGL